MTVAIAQRFQVLEKLGEGRVAVTYKAFDFETQAEVVIKRLRPEIYQDSRLRAQVRHHLHSWAQIAHPQIVPLKEAREARGKLFWVLPYLAGGSLADKLREEAFSAAKIETLLTQIAEILTFVHAEGMVHYNLKPENILFDDAGQVYLTDFELVSPAQLSSQVTFNAAHYLSPEQWLRLGKVGDSADIYALGIIAYQALAGHLPFRGSSVAEIAQAHHFQPLPESDQLPSHKQAIISTMLAKQPADRYQSMQAAATALAVPPPKPPFPYVRVALFLLLPLILLYFVTQFWSIIGAAVADPLRSVLGNENVAEIEETLFQIQDQAEQAKFELGLEEPAPLWEVPTATPTEPPASVAPAATITPVATAVPLTSWEALTAVQPLGTLPGEGVWEAYIFDPAGATVAQRTFLQPDSERPLTVIAVVAFDMSRLNLHFVLGSEEPSVANGPRGNGTIPTRDKVSGDLLATFNGGFKGTHGNFGAMADGVVAVPARPGLATVGIDESGMVHIGEWGRDLFGTQPWHAWRQNALLLISHATINPDVYNTSVKDWGGTIDNEIVTWRSALGVAADQQTLFYIVGPALSVPALANAGMALGAENLMLLDINPYWVHFAKIVVDEQNNLVAEPLFAEEMDLHKDRYLTVSSRDFFYITAR